MLLRTLMKARYSERNFGHFWLASKFYSHFTSPIRRYPDLQIHRIIKEVIHKDITPKRKSHYQEILPKVALRSSEREVLSERIEYRVRDYMAVQYMKDKVGEEFQAKVSGMIEKWFFVELPNTIEWFVEFGLSNLSYDAESFSVFSPITGQELTFWDEVQVWLLRADEETLRLDFELLV
jgi:ribonuclease R